MLNIKRDQSQTHMSVEGTPSQSLCARGLHVYMAVRAVIFHRQDPSGFLSGSISVCCQSSSDNSETWMVSLSRYRGTCLCCCNTARPEGICELQLVHEIVLPWLRAAPVDTCISLAEINVDRT